MGNAIWDDAWMKKTATFLKRMCAEPPFRIISKALVKRLSASVRTKAHWDAVLRPHYLTGVLAGADQAAKEGRDSISVYEFGVAGGNGLLTLAAYAEEVEKETGIHVSVYGFDTGTGLSSLIGGYKDYADHWQEGDYPMDEGALRARLPANTQLIIGDVANSLPDFMLRIQEPIGFVACDLDIYSATLSMLQMFKDPNRKMLLHVPMYFDDLEYFFMHRFAGELAAIDEFNDEDLGVKIDIWRGVEKHRPFPEAYWLKKMFVAHDIEAIAECRVARAVETISIDQNAYAVM